MTNTSTAVADAMRALVTLMRATSGYRSCWADGTGVPVYHSAEAGLIGEQPVTSLVIGDLGDLTSVQEAADGTQRLATLGTLRHRDEELTIRCRATAVTGDATDGTTQATWDAAIGIIDDVDTLLRGNGSLGLVPAYRYMQAVLAGVTGVRPYLGSGVIVDVLFDIRVTARI
jgi:hypothetical protein